MDTIQQKDQKEAIFDGSISVTAVYGDDDEIYVPLKQFCDEIGIDWEAQRKRVKRHHTFGPGSKMVYVTGAYGTRPQLCLPLYMVGGWMLGIDPNRLSGREAAEILAIFQKEAEKRIADLFKERLTVDGQSFVTYEVGLISDMQKNQTDLIHTVESLATTVGRLLQDVSHLINSDQDNTAVYADIAESVEELKQRVTKIEKGITGGGRQ